MTSSSLFIPPVFLLLNFITGMSFSAVGSILPDLTRLYGLSTADVSSVPLIQFFGSFLGLLCFGFLSAKPRQLLLGTSAVMGLSSAALCLIPSFSTGFKAAFFFFGAASMVAVALPGIVIARAASGNSPRGSEGGPGAEESSNRGGSATSLIVVYSFYSAGVTAAPLAFGALISRGYHYPVLFLIFALLSLVIMAASVFSRLPDDPIEQGLHPGRVAELFREHRTLIVLVVLMNLLYTSAESVPNIWIPQYFTDTYFGYPEFRSRIILSLFWGAITVGRQLCALAVRRGAEPGRLLLFLAATAAAALFLAPRLGARGSAEILFAGSGLFYSAMFPIIASYNERFPGRMRTSFFILIMAAGTAGISVTSRLTGLVSDRFGFTAGTLLGPAFLLLLIAIGVAAGKPSPGQSNIDTD